MKKGAIFDMDGLLFDTERLFRDGWVEMAKQFGQIPKVASGYYITGASKMRKDDLAAAVEQALLEPGRFEKILFMVDDSCWRLIQDLAVADGPLPVPPELIKYANMFSQLGYLRYDGDGYAGTVEMPVEIKSLLVEMEKDGFPVRKAQADMLHAYTQAAVNLYGLIEAEELVDIINRQNEKEIDYGELLLSQLPHWRPPFPRQLQRYLHESRCEAPAEA